MTQCPIRKVECSGMEAYDYIRDVQRDPVIDIDEVTKLCGRDMNLYLVQDLETPNLEVPRPDCALTHYVLAQALGGEQ